MRTGIFSTLAAIAICSLSGAAWGAFLSIDGNAMPAFRGTQHFGATNGLISFDADVEFAVYAPGAFIGSFGAGSDPSGGLDYIYAYQVHNTGISGEKPVNFLSVGFDGNENPANIEFLPHAFGVFGIDPTAPGFIPAIGPYTSATWAFNNVITIGNSSQIVLYSSAAPPEFDDASVKSGALISQQTMPSPGPVPEPGMIGGALVAGLLAIAKRRRI